MTMRRHEVEPPGRSSHRFDEVVIGPGRQLYNPVLHLVPAGSTPIGDGADGITAL